MVVTISVSLPLQGIKMSGIRHSSIGSSIGYIRQVVVALDGIVIVIAKVRRSLAVFHILGSICGSTFMTRDFDVLSLRRGASSASGFGR